MQLFVIRHAPAVPRGTEARDEARPLTPRAQKRWKRAVRGLERLGLGFDRLYHSPWVRAAETASALAGLVEVETIVMPELARAPTPALIERLEGDRVAVVGHQPWLGELVGVLLGDPRGAAWLEIGKGSVAWLEGELRPGGMKLLALLPARVLRAARR